ncbi:MAG: DMT family transporter [Pseudomonadota bacterium]
MPRFAAVVAGSPPSRPTIATGIWLYLGALFLLAAMYTLMKLIADRYPATQIVFFRATIGFLPMIFLVKAGGGLASLRTKRPLGHVSRGIINLSVLISFAFALSVLPLADTYAISFAAPLFVAALAIPFLGERVDGRRWVAVIAGFVGVLIVVRPGSAGADNLVFLGAIAALVGALSYALSLVTARMLGQTETPAAVGFYPAAIIAVGAFGLLPYGFVWPTAGDFIILVMIGVLGGMSTILINAAFRVAPSAVLAPLDYSGMIWAVLFGFAIWGNVPDSVTFNGAAIIAASGLYVLHREAAAKRRLVAA